MKKSHYFKYYLPSFIVATILTGMIASLDLAHWTATTFIVCYAIFLVLAGLATAVFTIRNFFRICDPGVFFPVYQGERDLWKEALP